jgi:hypothetical protein
MILGDNIFYGFDFRELCVKLLNLKMELWCLDIM